MLTPAATARPPIALIRACERLGVRPTPWILVASVARQRLRVFAQASLPKAKLLFPKYKVTQELVISTSRHGTGQIANSNQTPLGLHRISEKIGDGQPAGTVFESRQAVGRSSSGRSKAAIAHRILWLEGLEPGFNRGGNVDSHDRYIYIHGVGDESRLGHPASSGCIHLAAADLLPLFDLIPCGTLIWIGQR